MIVVHTNNSTVYSPKNINYSLIVLTSSIILFEISLGLVSGVSMQGSENLIAQAALFIFIFLRESIEQRKIVQFDF